MHKRVLSIGQCGADGPVLARILGSQFHADVVEADTAAEAMESLRQGDFDLVLVNRVFFRDNSSGLDFIGKMKSDPALRDTPVMLVSNYEDAQNQAVARGALPGFGKAALRDAETMAKLRAILTPEPAGQGKA